MRKKRTQIIFFLAWTTTSLIFYVAVPFCYEIVNYNSDVENSSVSLGCDFIDYNSQMIASYMDLTMRDILPFMVMSIFSILLIISIFRTRMRLMTERTTVVAIRR